MFNYSYEPCLLGEDTLTKMDASENLTFQLTYMDKIVLTQQKKGRELWILKVEYSIILLFTIYFQVNLFTVAYRNNHNAQISQNMN